MLCLKLFFQTSTDVMVLSSYLLLEQSKLSLFHSHILLFSYSLSFQKYNIHFFFVLCSENTVKHKKALDKVILYRSRQWKRMKKTHQKENLMKIKCMKKKKVLKNSSKNCILIYMFLNNSLYLAYRQLNIYQKSMLMILNHRLLQLNKWTGKKKERWNKHV